MRAVSYVLGLDLGVSSIGWAAIELDEDENPISILGAGSRIFPAGLDDLEKGKGESPCAKRRAARMRRRLLQRRSRRRQKLFNQLFGLGLVPTVASPPPGRVMIGDPVYRSLSINPLYAELVQRWSMKMGLSHDEVASKLPYLIRRAALTEVLEPFELGYCIYQLSARRGYSSNRKPPPEKKARKKSEEAIEKEAAAEEARIVLGGIKRLEGEITKAGTTLGGYLATINPKEVRIRERYTSRKMLEEEFDAVVSAQASYHHTLQDPAVVARMRRIIFHQRPLKSVAHLIGPCELVGGAKRASMALLSSQRFRMLAGVNNLRVSDPKRPWLGSTPLNGDQRVVLLSHLEAKGDITTSEAKKLLGISAGQKLSAEAAGKIKGDRASTLLRRMVPTWDTMTLKERDALINDLKSIQKPEVFQRRAVKLGVDPSDAAELHGPDCFEEEYLAFSTRAVYAMLPRLERGMDTTNAQMQAFPKHFRPMEPVERLAPVKDVLPNITNPLVSRTLSEVRGVVNELLTRFGKPKTIRVELARNLKQSAKGRAADLTANQSRERERDQAARMYEDCYGSRARASDVEKILLWEECRRTCPYTGKSIQFEDLFGPDPLFDVEHVIPFSRCLDDSFLNKTLCCREENRRVKRNRTPRECYSDIRLREITDRVKGFKLDARDRAVKPGHTTSRDKKLARFEANTEEVKEMLSDFASRQLNDTRYAAVEAVRYVSTLYGGSVDVKGMRRVQASSGGVTAYLRDVWDMNRILTGGTVKQRDDHRHHAVDAVAIALSDANIISDLSHAAARGRKRRFGPVPPPWPTFYEDVTNVVGEVIVSHRRPKIAAGRFHEETHYSAPKREFGKGPDSPTATHVRKPIRNMSVNEQDAIVDPTVRTAVLACTGGAAPKDYFKAEVPLPTITTKSGKMITIRSARIRTSVKAVPVGAGHRVRYVKLGGNSHAEITEKPGRAGKKLADEVVSILSVARRTASREGQVKVPPGGFVVRRGCTMELDSLTPGGGRELYVVRAVSQTNYELVRVNDARPKGEINKSKDTLKITSLSKFVERHARTVRVSPCGFIK
jgi:CRISPR-associated endonuclease Csn1